MGIRLAETAGFCWGVRRAVDLALRVSHENHGPIYTFGPLIHNRQALDLLKTKGIDQLPKEADRLGPASVIVRAHGVAPQVKQDLEDRGFEVLDATCPHVARAQKIVRRMAEKACAAIVIVGDRGHAEVEGLLGHADGRGFVVESPEDVARLPDGLDSVAVVAQTTQGGDRWEQCVAALAARFGDIEVFNTRCNDTNSRQEELLRMAEEVDAIVVVGGRGSANTCRLAEIARERVPTWHIETAEELPVDALRPFGEIGVTAGASTPHWIIEQVVDRLRAMQRQRRPLLVRAPAAGGRLLILGQVVLAAGAAALAAAAAQIMQIPYRWEYSVLPFLYLWAMHLLHLFATLPRDLSLVSGPMRAFAGWRRQALAIGLTSLAGGLILSALMGAWVFALVALSTLVGTVYSFGRLPRTVLPHFRFRRLHNIPGSKDACVAAAWAMMVVIVPWVHARSWTGLEIHHILPLLVTATFAYGLSLVRSVAVDLRQLEGDLLLGRETLPVFIGPRRTHALLTSMLAILCILALGGLVAAPLRSGLILLPTVALMAVAYALTYGQRIRSYYAWAFLLDLPFLVAGVLGVVL